jgi:ketosteroid isomerase-like protein
MNPVRMSQVEATTRLVLEFHDALNRHDVPAMMARMSADCLFENTYPAPDGTPYVGKEAVSRFWEEFFQQSPNARIEVEEIFGLGNRCVLRWRYEWTDESGEKGHVRGVDIFKVRDGLICEKLSYVKG